MKSTFRLLLPRMRCLPHALALLLLASAPGHANERLRNHPSPFLRAHLQGHVDWMPWGPEAFERAAQENRPVYLAVGSLDSELSMAMNRQTFSNPDIARFLNEHFVCILVDRKEHPAVAAQGQAYVRAVKQLSGWPLNLWLTPELLPFDGATYLPPSEEWGKEGFLNAAQRVAAAWESAPDLAREDAQRAVALVREFEASPEVEPFRVNDVRMSLDGSASAWRGQSDDEHGGFGETPRHPEPEMLRFLLRSAEPSRDAAVANLHAMLASAVRDPIDGGFFRYTADPTAHMPYFQKRLGDQARIVLALLDAQGIAPDPAFASVARGALDYVLGTLALPDGTFASGEDATATGAAAYYAWTYDELTKALGNRVGATFAEAHGAKPKGNVSAEEDPSQRFLGQNILSGAPSSDHRESVAKLRAIRDRREKPARDESVIAEEQGLIVLALARAGRELSEPRYLEAARRTAQAIQDKLLRSPQGDLRRLAGSDAPASPGDHAAVTLGLRALEDANLADLAGQIIERGDALFLDAATGILYTTPAELPRGIWLRLPAPASTPGDTLASAPLRLLAGEPFPKALPALLATQHRDPSIAASGDILLALRVYVDRLP